MDNLQFIPYKFIENLQYMGVGMLGVFMIVGIIALATYVISSAVEKAKSDKSSE